MREIISQQYKIHSNPLLSHIWYRTINHTFLVIRRRSRVRLAFAASAYPEAVSDMHIVMRRGNALILHGETTLQNTSSLPTDS